MQLYRCKGRLRLLTLLLFLLFFFFLYRTLRGHFLQLQSKTGDDELIQI